MAKIADYKGHEVDVDSDGRFQAIRHGRVAAEAETLEELKRALDALSGSKFPDLGEWMKSKGAFTRISEDPEVVLETAADICDAVVAYVSEYPMALEGGEGEANAFNPLVRYGIRTLADAAKALRSAAKDAQNLKPYG